MRPPTGGRLAGRPAAGHRLGRREARGPPVLGRLLRGPEPEREFVPVGDLVQSFFLDEFTMAGIETKPIP